MKFSNHRQMVRSIRWHDPHLDRRQGFALGNPKVINAFARRFCRMSVAVTLPDSLPSVVEGLVDSLIHAAAGHVVEIAAEDDGLADVLPGHRLDLRHI